MAGFQAPRGGWFWALNDILKDHHHYRGYLSADALNIYDHLFRDGLVLEIGCWAHARRKFYDAKVNDAARSHVAMAHIRRLYAIETEARTLVAARQLEGVAADAVYLELRQNKSLPELTAFKKWLEAEQPKVLPKSLIGLAIAYVLKHWQALTRFVNDGFLAIDNNVAERTLRHIAIGRKNWLFAGSAQGAETAATLFSIMSSCHRHGVDVFAYLQDILQRLAHDAKPAPEQLRAWLPDRWKPPPKPEKLVTTPCRRPHPLNVLELASRRARLAALGLCASCPPRHHQPQTRLRRTDTKKLALIRRMAVSLLQKETTTKQGVAGKRKKAGWDDDYLIEVLGAALA